MSRQNFDSSKKSDGTQEAQGVEQGPAPHAPESAHALLRMQQTYGNRAVGRFLQSGLPLTPARPQVQRQPVPPAEAPAEAPVEGAAEEVVVVAPREAAVGGVENSKAAEGEKPAAPAAARAEQKASDLGIPPEKLQETIAGIGSYLRAAEDKRSEQAEELGRQAAVEKKVATVTVDVPIDKSLLASKDINYTLAVRAFQTLFKQYGIYLDSDMAGRLYSRSSWTPLMNNAGVRAAVADALDKGADTISYLGQGMPTLVTLYNQIRAEDRARYEKIIEDLHKIHYAEDAVKSFYIAHWNGLIGVIGGIPDLLLAPQNLIQSIRGKEGVHLDLGIVKKLTIEYPGEYGKKYGGTLETGVAVGLMFVPGGAGEGVAAGTSWLGKLVSGLSPGGLPVGATLLKIIRTGLTTGVISAGALAVKDLHKSARQLISGQKELADGTTQPLTSDEAGKLLEGIIMQALMIYGGAKAVQHLKPGAAPEAPPKGGEAPPELKPPAEPPAQPAPPEAQPHEPAAPPPEPKAVAPAPEPKPVAEPPEPKPAPQPAEEVKPQPPPPEAKAAEPPAVTPGEVAPEPPARPPEPAPAAEAPKVEEAPPEAKPETPVEAAKPKRQRGGKKKAAEPVAAEAAAGEAAPAAEGPAPAKPAKTRRKRASEKPAEESEKAAPAEKPGPTPQQRMELLQQEKARLQKEQQQNVAEEKARIAEEKRLNNLKELAEENLQELKERERARPEALEQATKKAEAAEAAWAEAEGQLKEAQNKIAETKKQIDRNAGDIERTKIALDPAKYRALLPCFSGDTPVWTVEGPRRIDSLAPGAAVLAFDFSRMDVVSRAVREVLVNRTEHFYEVRTGDGVVRATGPHLFWVESDSDWVATRDLRPGMLLRTPDGRTAAVSSVTLREVPETASYNLSVEDAHNYFVGPGLLVHNEGPIDLKLARIFIIYRARYVGKDARFVGKTYIGQTTEVSLSGKSAGKPRGVEKRGDEHVANAERKLELHARENNLKPEEVEFYEFMKDTKLEELVVGIETKAQADYLEQENIVAERRELGSEFGEEVGKKLGEQNVMNRREQIKSGAHAKGVKEQIIAELKAMGHTCPP